MFMFIGVETAGLDYRGCGGGFPWSGRQMAPPDDMAHRDGIITVTTHDLHWTVRVWI
jgi:hypothetical protein